MAAALTERLAAIEARVAAACARAGRARGDVRIVGVTKSVGADGVRAAVGAGLARFGENYVQEWVAKRDALADLAGTVEWHFIGRIQRNKAAAIADAALVHSLADPRAGEALATIGARRGRPVRALVQVNLDAEPTKAGVAPEALREVLRALRGLDGLAIDGLMAIPAPLDADGMRACFRRLRELRDHQDDPSRLPELSMGMSDDFEIAIEEGATLVRIGTAIFGPRKRKD